MPQKRNHDFAERYPKFPNIKAGTEKKSSDELCDKPIYEVAPLLKNKLIKLS